MINFIKWVFSVKIAPWSLSPEAQITAGNLKYLASQHKSFSDRDLPQKCDWDWDPKTGEI